MKIVNQFKLSDKLFGVIGRAIGDAEQASTKNGNTYVKFALNIGKDDEKPQGKQGIIANCETWEGQSYALNILKGDTVLAIGSINSREYQGRTYTTFECKWLNVMKLINGGSSLEQFAEAAQSMGVNVETAGEFQEVEGDDLPF